MCKHQISTESKNKLELLRSLSENKDQDEILRLLLGKQENLTFMQKYKDDFLNKAQTLKQLIEKLRNIYDIIEIEIDEAISVMESLKWNIKINTILDNERVIINSYKAFLFIHAFTTDQLTFLSDIGVRIPIQVLDGQAQPYANGFLHITSKTKIIQQLLKIIYILVIYLIIIRLNKLDGFYNHIIISSILMQTA